MSRRNRAECAQVDDGVPRYDWETWFPVGKGHKAEIQTALAVSICRLCPVAAECRKSAHERREPFGIWGGLTEDDRTKLARREQRVRLEERRAAEAGESS